MYRTLVNLTIFFLSPLVIEKLQNHLIFKFEFLLFAYILLWMMAS
jgi:hypothetical protein